MEVDYRKLYKKATDDLQFYKNQYHREAHLAGKYAAELEKKKHDEARAFCRGVFVTCVTALMIVGIMCVYVR